METINWLGLVGLLMVAALVFPGAFRANRRTWLGYAAIWLAVIAALVFAYEWFGPL